MLDRNVKFHSPHLVAREQHKKWTIYPSNFWKLNAEHESDSLKIDLKVFLKEKLNSQTDEFYLMLNFKMLSKLIETFLAKPP